MKSLIRLTAVEMKLLFRDRTLVFWTFAFPILMIWILGAIFGNKRFGEWTFAQAYIPAWIALNTLTVGLYAVGVTLALYRETGVLARYQVTPVHPAAVLLAHLLSGMFQFVVSAALLVGFGTLFYDLKMPKYPGSLAAATLLGMTAVFSFSLFATQIVRNTRQVYAVSNLFMNASFLLCGATFPMEMLPKFLQAIAKALPLYYVTDLIRAAWYSAPIQEQGTDVLALAAATVLFSCLAVWTFRWTDSTKRAA